MKPTSIISTRLLDLLGLTPKDRDVYLSLLKLGAAPLRRIGEESGLNRATAYDALRKLIDVGLVHYLDAKRHRYFVAEDPERLRGLVTRREVALAEAREKLELSIPKLRALVGQEAYRPAVRYLEGEQGVKDLLEDVLATSAKTKRKMYRIYSSSDLREAIYKAWPKYSQERKKREVSVRAIAMGQGGETVGLDERRWLSRDEGAPTYTFIYGTKVANVAIDHRKELFVVLTDHEAVAKTQVMIFDALWKSLG